jgi:hypothetical protein
MRSGDQCGAGIGDRRTTGLGDERNVVSGTQRRKPALDRSSVGIVADLDDRYFTQGPRVADRLEEGSRRFRIFREEVLDAACDVEHLGRQHGERGRRGDRGRQQDQ